MAAAAYIEQYFDCVEALPLDLQRCVTQLREIEMDTQGLCGEIERLRLDFLSAVRDGDGDQQKVLFRRLQQCMLRAREVGNTKLEISAQLLDIAEDYTQKLTQRCKDMENHPRCEDPYHSPRYSYNSTKGESPLSMLSNGVSETKPSGKKNSGTKRPRQSDKGHVHNNEEEVSLPSGGVAKESNSGRSKDNNNSSVSSNVKPPKKKVKTIKKKSATTTKEKETSSSSSTPQVHMPMPDLTSKPLDPNEPTYCLCQQVSFGEMIGCDNDDCPIEWFHFQCVGLTSKPKGKWYCPQCAQERRSSRTSK